MVIEDLLAGRTRVDNLHLLHAAADHRIGPFELLGLGGNILPDRLADVPSPLSGQGGKIWTTLAQLGALAEAMQRPKDAGGVRVRVSHLRGATLPRWYRGGFHINLPDVPDGYAVLTATAGGLKLETVSHGLRLGL